MTFHSGEKPMLKNSLITEQSIQRVSGRESRTQSIATRFTPAEEDTLAKAAEANGQNLREWVREILLREAHGESTVACTDQILIEIVGLQLFLTDVLSPIACGERLTSAQYEELMRNVKTTKRRAAHDAIAQFRAEAGEERHG
jgi:uncharacterized protein (DUF1778 family)